MLDTRIVLAGFWVATMLTYLWGDVLGLIAGHTEPGKLGDVSYAPTHGMWVGIAALMMMPILMIVLTLILKFPAIRWVNIVVAIIWILFNLSSLSGYPPYEKFTLIVSMGFNALTVYYAWQWEV
jgi:putative exporter of polyketide antibiotics